MDNIKHELKINNLSFSYETNPVLKDISFNVSTGKIVGLIGENGAGKTTIIKNIVGILKTKENYIFIDNESVSYKNKMDFPIAYLPDSPHLYENLTVLEHLLLICKVYGINIDEAYKYMKMFELIIYKDKMPYQLSKGNRQKLMIICTTLKNFQFLLADEPFEGLDPEQIYRLKNYLISLRDKSKGIIISTHLINMVEDMCDEYIFIYKGAVLVKGTKEQIRKQFQVTEKSMEKVYLEIMKLIKNERSQ